jgi:NADH dehydrogenase [ubiquinone] 1 alpha subcomplex assembly factor 1
LHNGLFAQPHRCSKPISRYYRSGLWYIFVCTSIFNGNYHVVFGVSTMSYPRLMIKFPLRLFFILSMSIAMANTNAAIPEPKVLFDFQTADDLAEWIIVNDGVMGGLSQSGIALSGNNTAIFSGTLSLENNGGFSSVRTRPYSYNLEGYDGITLRIKGDGRTYQFRLRTDERFDGYAYRSLFETTLDRWMEVRIPFAQCVPVFRGRILSDVGPLVPQQIQQIGFLIADKQEGPFRLEIDWIKAYKNDPQ